MATNLENSISRIQGNVTAALAALSAKGVSVTGADSDDLATLIDYLVKLPALTTAGAAADLRNGKQLIDGSGNIVTGTMPEQEAQTITPGTSDKTIASGRYLTGTQTIEGDANLVAANIASGKTIFGVTGTHSGGGKMKTGSFTIANGTSTHTITHGLGKTPNLAISIATNPSAGVNNDLIFSVIYNGNIWRGFGKVYAYGNDVSVTETTLTITSSNGNGFGSANTNTIQYSRSVSSKDRTIDYIIGVV